MKKKQTEKTEKKLSELKQNLEQYEEHRVFVIERRKKRRENPSSGNIGTILR